MKDRSNRVLFIGWVTMVMLAITGNGMTADPDSPDRIQPNSKNPLYWQFKGEPVLLIGGSVDDNLFQIDNLEEHLNLLASAGENYVRCTMSSRDSGNVQSFVKENGLFNLEKPDPDYWNRFETLLLLALKRDIIVQVELWATYDFYWGDYGWAQNPFNPIRNSSYTAPESQLPEAIDYPAQLKNNPFFRSVPELDNNRVVLAFQQKFADKLMSIALKYPNVLYCIDNETKARPEWGRCWSAYIRQIATAAGKNIYVTEMWDNWEGKILESYFFRPRISAVSPASLWAGPESRGLASYQKHAVIDR